VCGDELNGENVGEEETGNGDAEATGAGRAGGFERRLRARVHQDAKAVVAGAPEPALDERHQSPVHHDFGQPGAAALLAAEQQLGAELDRRERRSLEVALFYAPGVHQVDPPDAERRGRTQHAPQHLRSRQGQDEVHRRSRRPGAAG